MDKEFSLKGEVALVTGSGRGLGHAIAVRLAELGADVAIHDYDEKAPAEFHEFADLHAALAPIARHGTRTHVVVGDIGDEYDIDDDLDIRKDAERQFTVKAQTRIGDFNEYFATKFSDEEFDTIGGLVMSNLGRLPRRGETFAFGGIEFKVLRGDRRRLDVLRIVTTKDIEPPTP